jgi:polysaccharide biosynthesis transport protein
VGVALGLEMADRRVRSPEDVGLALGLPVIGLMPKPGGRQKLPSPMQQRLMGPAPRSAARA